MGLIKDITSCHAEMDVLIKAGFGKHLNRMMMGLSPPVRTTKISLMVIRVNSDGDFANSMPCKFCKDFIIYCGIKTVYYTDSKGRLITDKILNVNSLFTYYMIISMEILDKSSLLLQYMKKVIAKDAKYKLPHIY